MNHYLLPVNTNNDPDHFRYGNTSLAYMVNRMISLGANTSMISAHVFCGSSMFSHTKNHFNIGNQNTEIALDF
jgi:chemotaxis receptor (MCP) glutamine deamidase CheD